MSKKDIEQQENTTVEEQNIPEVEAQAAEKGEQSEQEQPKEPSLQEQLDEATDKYVRMAAEFDNYRRRTAKERIDLISTASEKVIVEILPILDDFEHALKALAQSEASDAAKEGTALIYNKFLAILKKQGVSQIEAQGAEFDTDFHEAVAQFPVAEEEKKNRVFDVVQQGYTLNGKVIRFAKVVIGI